MDDYYKAASSAQRVGDVAVPLLVIQAADDPIAPIAGTPTEALRDNPNCILAGTPPSQYLIPLVPSRAFSHRQSLYLSL